MRITLEEPDDWWELPADHRRGHRARRRRSRRPGR
jgi:hypothetical protein